MAHFFKKTIGNKIVLLRPIKLTVNLCNCCFVIENDLASRRGRDRFHFSNHCRAQQINGIPLREIGPVRFGGIGPLLIEFPVRPRL